MSDDDLSPELSASENPPEFLSLEGFISNQMVQNPQWFPSRRISFATPPVKEPEKEYEYEIIRDENCRKAVIDILHEKVTLYCPSFVEVEQLLHARVRKFIEANNDKEVIEVRFQDVVAFNVNPHMQHTCKWFTASESQKQYIAEEFNKEVVLSDAYSWDSFPNTTSCSHPSALEVDSSRVTPCGFDGDMVLCRLYEAEEWVPVRIAKSRSGTEEIVLSSTKRGLGYVEMSFFEPEGEVVVNSVNDFESYAESTINDYDLSDPVITTPAKNSFLKSILS